MAEKPQLGIYLTPDQGGRAFVQRIITREEVKGDDIMTVYLRRVLISIPLIRVSWKKLAGQMFFDQSWPEINSPLRKGYSTDISPDSLVILEGLEDVPPRSLPLRSGLYQVGPVYFFASNGNISICFGESSEFMLEEEGGGVESPEIVEPNEPRILTFTPKGLRRQE